MLAWCPTKQSSFFISLSEINECSAEARYWIEGYLHGNEPEPPIDKDGDVDFDSEDYRSWLKQCEAFRSDGRWSDSSKSDDIVTTEK